MNAKTIYDIIKYLKISNVKELYNLLNYNYIIKNITKKNIIKKNIANNDKIIIKGKEFKYYQLPLSLKVLVNNGDYNKTYPIQFKNNKKTLILRWHYKKNTNIIQI